MCYFLKSIKSVFILVQCNTSLSKSYVAHSYVTVVCVTGWIWEKNWFVCTLRLSVHMKSVVEQEFSRKFAFDNKALITFVEIRIWWKRSKFERRRIRIRTWSHPYPPPLVIHFNHTVNRARHRSGNTGRAGTEGRRTGLRSNALDREQRYWSAVRVRAASLLQRRDQRTTVWLWQMPHRSVAVSLRTCLFCLVFSILFLADIR